MSTSTKTKTKTHALSARELAEWHRICAETGLTIREFSECMSVADELGYHVYHLRQRDRAMAISEARQVLCYVLTRHFGWHMTRVGEILDRDHSTISYSVSTIQGYINTDSSFRTKIEKLIQFLLR